jgi:hypothetical protein
MEKGRHQGPASNDNSCQSDRDVHQGIVKKYRPDLRPSAVGQSPHRKRFQTEKPTTPKKNDYPRPTVVPDGIISLRWRRPFELRGRRHLFCLKTCTTAEAPPWTQGRYLAAALGTSVLCAGGLLTGWAKFSCPCGTPRSARQAGDPQI